MFKDRKPFQHLYSSKWNSYSKAFLRHNPLCVYCKQVGVVGRAEVTDHIKPHKGDIKLFWDKSNHQPLCKHCHDSVKAKEEARGYAVGCDSDGIPLDKNHFWNED